MIENSVENFEVYFDSAGTRMQPFNFSQHLFGLRAGFDLCRQKYILPNSAGQKLAKLISANFCRLKLAEIIQGFFRV